jgi:hypothetical protein
VSGAPVEIFPMFTHKPGVLLPLLLLFLCFQGPQLGSGYVSLQSGDDLPLHHEVGYNDVSAYHSHAEDYRLSPYQQACLCVTSRIFI